MKIKIDNELYLELLNELHAEEIFGLTEKNRLFLDKWLPWVKYTKSKEDTLIFINNSMKEYSEGTGLQASIFFNDKLSGVIGLMDISKLRNSSEIGYWLGEEYMGKGIMTKACKALTDTAFRDYDINRIKIICDINNISSQKIPERLGYFNQGILKNDKYFDGEYGDHFHFVIWRDEWELKRNNVSV